MTRNHNVPSDRFSTFAEVIFAIVFLGGLVWVTIDAKRFAPVADFKVFYAAGKIVAEGHGPDLYEPAVQEQVLHRVAAGRVKYFYNPPAFVLPFAALAGLPLMTAYWLWTVISLAATLVGIVILLNLSGLAPPQRRMLALAALAFEPIYHNLRWGNITALVLLLVALFFRDLLTGKERRAGIWLALLMVKPELFLALAAVLLAKRKWRAVTSYLVGGVVLLAASLGVVGWRGFGRYGALNLTALRGCSADHTEAKIRELLNWQGLLVRSLGDGTWAEGLTLLLTLFSGVVLYLVWRGGASLGSERYRARWALTVLVCILIAPHVHVQSLAIVIAAACLLLGRPEQKATTLTQQSLAHLALTAVALSWLPEINLMWGLTILQLALITATSTLALSLLRRPAENMS